MRKIKNFIFLSFFVFCHSSLAAEDPPPEPRNIEALVNACVVQKSRDEVCKTLIKIKQLGDDYVEAIKEYADLSPDEYAILTTANMIVTKRFRIRYRSLLIKHKKANDIFDYNNGDFTYSIEIPF